MPKRIWIVCSRTQFMNGNVETYGWNCFFLSCFFFQFENCMIELDKITNFYFSDFCGYFSAFRAHTSFRRSNGKVSFLSSRQFVVLLVEADVILFDFY